jgi:uncharacterized protein (DUF2141 family)
MIKANTILAMMLGGAVAMAAAPTQAADAPRASTSCTAAAGQSALAIAIKGVHSSKGEVAITIYPGDPNLFLAPHAKLSRVRLPAAPIVHACMDVPHSGDYAIAIYHDENGDHKFNRTLFGMPAEGYGFSNDAPTVAGLPTYSANKFTAHEGVTSLTITMRY